MSKWMFWRKVKETPTNKRTWWRLKSTCPTCGRVDEIRTRQAKLFEFAEMEQKTLEVYA